MGPYHHLPRRLVLLTAGLLLGLSSAIVAEDCNWNWVDDTEDIAQGTSQDCNTNAVPDECDSTPEPFTSNSGWLMPVGGSSPKTFTVPAARTAAGDVTLSLAVSADLGNADKSIEVSLRGFGPIGTVFGTSGACPPIPEVTEFVVSRWSYNYAISTGQVIFDLVPTGAVDGSACGGNSYLSATVNYDVAALPDCNENDLLDECDIAEGTSADVNTNGRPDECESVQQGCIVFDTVPVPPYPGGGGGYTAADISGNTLTLPGGTAQRIWLELRISNWACTGGPMGTWQAQYGPDASLPFGFTRPPQTCVDAAACNAAGMGCAPPGCSTVCNAGFCDPVFEQQTAQQPTALNYDIEACMTTNLACGGTQVTTPAVVDTGIPRYAMTLVLNVSPAFTGCADINVQNLQSDTFFQDGTGQQIPIGKAITAEVCVPLGRCCELAGSCIDNVPRGLCDVGPVTFWQEGVACPQSGGPPCFAPSACCDGNTGQCTDGASPQECVGDQLEYFHTFDCIEITCVEHTGACCRSAGASAVCVNGLTDDECSALCPGQPDPEMDDCVWFKDEACQSVAGCESTAIPTVSSWGLLVLTLVLLVGAKAVSHAHARSRRRA